MLEKVKKIKASLKEYGEVRRISECAFVEIQNMILDDKNIDLCKKAWKMKSGLNYPFVYNQDKEVCTYVGNRMV